MKLGICTSLNNLSAAAEAGFDFVEVSTAALLPQEDAMAFAEIRKTIAESPIPVIAANCFIPGRLKVTGDEIDTAALSEYMDMILGRSSEVGIKTMVFGSGGARKLPDDYPEDKGWDQLAAAARMAADIGAKHGVMIVMEPLHRKGCNFFNRVDQGAAFVDRVNHPNLKLLADLFHMHSLEEPLENVRAAGARLHHIHLATPAIPEIGEGVEYDFRGFFKNLGLAKYDGPVSVEDNPHLLATLEAPLVPAYTAMVRFLRAESAAAR